MSFPDWLILIVVLLGIIFFGVYKSRANENLDGFLVANRSLPWYMVLLGIMGTQASAITYLTGPGQAYTDGLRFVQYYFGLPFAMVVIAVFFVPVFSRLKVLTAYEFLENRFDLKTRSLASILFLLSRGLSTGLSIYAPSIVLSAMLGWNMYLTNVIVGGLLIIYTVSGGASAIAHTQKIQMLIVFATLILSSYVIVQLVTQSHTITSVFNEAAQHGKLNFITSGINEHGFNWQDKYNIWSGLIGGFFLALGYFGTDHSQVGRYISGKNLAETRKGLILNGLVKIPMQYFILLLGVLVFVFYQQQKAPVYFNDVRKHRAMQSSYAGELQQIERQYEQAQLQKDDGEMNRQRQQYLLTLKKAHPNEDSNDTNFIFLKFAKDHFPPGLLGLFFAILFISAWGSIAAALHSLAACSIVDFHKRFSKKQQVNEVRLTKIYLLAWGVLCIAISMFANNIGNSLIEAVNILGSLFYGVMLGIFVCAIWMKRLQSNAVFWAGITAQLSVFFIYYLHIISFLWLNIVGVLLVILFATVFHVFSKRK